LTCALTGIASRHVRVRREIRILVFIIFVEFELLTGPRRFPSPNHAKNFEIFFPREPRFGEKR
jgi:hypothetical protein